MCCEVTITVKIGGIFITKWLFHESFQQLGKRAKFQVQISQSVKTL